MSTIRVNAIQHTTANSGNMILHANGNVSMITSNTTLFVGNTAISNAGISVGGAAINPLATGMRNRIINGAMMIDQRYSGTANTVNANVNNQYNLDRWTWYNTMGTGAFTVQQMNAANTSASNYEANSAPAGFINSMKMTVSTANTTPAAASFCRVIQPVEGLNVTDLGWGTSSAKPVTLSFWVKSSLAGSYSAVLLNNTGTRTNPQSYTISAANTWQYVSITYAGDTTGTWLTNNNIGVFVDFWFAGGSLYVTSSPGWNGGTGYEITGQSNLMATVGNTFYITGVQLEVGTTATPFEFRHYGQELALCQRYYWQIKETGAGVEQEVGIFTAQSASQAYTILQNPVYMRATPTGTITGNFQWTQTGVQNTVTPSFVLTGIYNNNLISIIVSGLTTGTTGRLSIASGASGVLSLSAEL